MRDGGEIGNDAFHTLENELDWMEVSDPLRRANGDEASRSSHPQENGSQADVSGA
jgi:hypothetical protein